MYAGEPMTVAVSPRAAVIAHAAEARRLTIYAGAGLSAAPPTALPGAARLAELIVDDLDSVVNMAGVDRRNLLAVADQVAQAPDGMRLLQGTLTRVGRFGTARFNYAHQAVALLVCEGAATVIETNYDDCVERAAMPEKLPVVVSDEERIDADVASLLKAHGCITRPHSMLITSEQLLHPPLFAKAELAARLSVGEVAFVGLGSPADYVIENVIELAGRVRPDRLTVVDPGIAEWATSPWSTVLPDLDEANRVTVTADEFCDEVLRFYVKFLLNALRSAVGHQDATHRQRRGTEHLHARLLEQSSVWALKWLRAVAWQFRIGDSVVTSSRIRQGLLALAALTAEAPMTFLASGIVRVDFDDAVYIVPITAADAPSGSQIALEAERRVADARTASLIPPTAVALVVCTGYSGPLGPGEIVTSRGDDLAAVRQRVSHLPPGDLIDSLGPGHLIDGNLAGAMFVMAGEPLIDI